MSKREYETTFILQPDVDETTKTEAIKRLTDILTEQFGGEIKRTDEWGRRKLAYLMKKQAYGVYVYIRHSSPAEAIAEMERIARLMDSVIKFLTVRLDDRIDDSDAPAPSELLVSHLAGGPGVEPTEDAPAESSADAKSSEAKPAESKSADAPAADTKSDDK
ncbi:MAG: small subunit ribosomal protein S6 [Bradymonadia bacterium]|jgi:small subunit ribosomal protein S6